MKINFIGLEPIEVTEDQAIGIKKALVDGVAYVSIGKNMYKASIITGVTDDQEHTTPITMWNFVPESRRLGSLKHRRAEVGSPAFEKFKSMRRKLGL